MNLNMELSKKETNMIKGMATLFLVFLHLFNTKDYIGQFKPILFYNNLPIVYYLSLVSGSCVSLYLFCSGYGLAMISKQKELKLKDNIIRVLKLLINYWIILLIFIGIGYILGYGSEYPGSIKKFLMNFLLLSKSYNGAWWFLQTYVILVLISDKIVKFVNKNNSFIIFIISGIIYFVAFLQTIKGIIPAMNNELFSILFTAIINFLSCQFTFIIGVIFVKESIISKLRSLFFNKVYIQILGYTSIGAVIIINAIIENYVIVPITAVAIICIFSVMKRSKFIEYVLEYFSKHSTNIWLTHMFFYMIFFKELVYAPKYPILIFLWLLSLCLFISYIINIIFKRVIRNLYIFRDRSKLNISDI